jgi:deoxyribonuclease V
MTIPHAWNVTPKEAVAIQKTLREQVSIEPITIPVRYVAGCDVSMNLYSKIIFAGFVVLSYPELEIVDHAVVRDETSFPYIPGLLSFREIPALLKAWEKLKTKPDLIFVDGVGIAHPRRIGIASHLGVAISVPTIGCAKSVLTGIYDEPGIERGEFSYLLDRFNPKEILGAALRTKRNVEPMFISPGHRITVSESITWVLKVTKTYRMPEPTRMAHNIMNEYRRNNTGS